ncbi:MAG: hydroxymethylglutaryl-CoA reductase, degradative [Cenarchaeum sp. SB0665_bin_23]|nr:hydroxymethylglutaryl-CoA reductase, degradative [Cenarchaeum sp. SB0667_bin_13]MXY61322.1 hydroxymethylglutaryl-CoA reductase, degradative [Cenarchaeum sp. SB0665_bin_23]MXZ93471.1 hydroxymethylglutaryl-CoA reductase, degradative [Cenarchaeum sp. SB0666_bin_15]MYC79165.1 hydroxymethylglutaryl-CoA reductase, degradative [Cenarchaeum sp. SB0661_bin_35]MYD58563.1 hydroxymethylglutaryl-CoA reductase, degradative [Cenarchaeum sp. SB0678_bin_8]MYG32625.1 hydroxymethylglutaryl-CoA reductase, degr
MNIPHNYNVRFIWHNKAINNRLKRTALHGFYRRSVDDRLEIVTDMTKLGAEHERALRMGMDMDTADSLVENVVGVYALPLGVATNFRINGKDVLVPMVTEEPSVIAAASAGAKATKDIKAAGPLPYVIGQIQVLNPTKGAMNMIKVREQDILDAANNILSKRMSAIKVTYAILADEMIKMEIVVDVGEAMGANAVNTMCECVAPLIQEITGGRVLLRILSNGAPHIGYAEAYFDVERAVAEDIVNAYNFALFDSSRAITHNKGVMNGVTAVGLATGQDTRALEAGAHAYAADKGIVQGGGSAYGPLSRWDIRKDILWGRLSMPLQVGVIGGLTTRHPAAAACLELLGNPSKYDLAAIMAAVGLCQNFSALRALATDGIQKGHMKLHRRRLE